VVFSPLCISSCLLGGFRRGPCGVQSTLHILLSVRFTRKPVDVHCSVNSAYPPVSEVGSDGDQVLFSPFIISSCQLGRFRWGSGGVQSLQHILLSVW
jgi:hypothetical protein